VEVKLMIRITQRLALVALMLLAPLSAHAAGLTVTNVSSSGASTSLLKLGDILTIDVVASNDTNLEIFGMGLDVSGYDTDENGLADNGIALLGGSVASQVFSQVYDPIGDQNFGGVQNIWTAPQEKGNPANPFAGIEAVKLHTVLVEGAALSPSTGDGSLDIGVDGGLVGDGDVHFRVQFQAITGIVSRQAVTLSFGIDPSVGNVVIGPGGTELPFSNDSVSFSVIPEPGTALLFGLGLAGLATTRRR
jgi:hypothetical protein